MNRVDEVIHRSLEQYGYSQVLVILNEDGAGSRALALNSSSLAASERSPFYLETLPTGVSASAAKVRALDASVFGTDSQRATARRSASRRSRRAEPFVEPTNGSLKAPASKFFPRLNVEWGFVDSRGLSELSQKPEVQEIRHVVPLSSISPVEFRPAGTSRSKWTWGLRELGIPKLRKMELTGRGIRVGHLDTGIDASHSAFKNCTIQFQESDFDGNPTSTQPRDSGRHGTHTAGTICGGIVNGMNIGVAPEALLFSGMVIEGGSLVRVLAGIEWCLENEVNVLNLSLGYQGYTPFFKTIMQQVIKQGVFPVVAIGNDDVGTSCSPGNYEEVFSVGAMQREKAIPTWSSSIVFNRVIDPCEPNVVAPGANILSARAGGGLLAMDGTSSAAPHVTGCVALLLQYLLDHGWSTRDPIVLSTLVQFIQMHCDPLSTFSVANSALRRGYGLIQPVKVLQELMQKSIPKS